METLKKKRTYPSLAQKARMVALLESDKDLQRGKFTSTFTKRDAERRWISIANNLNSLPGARKAWTEWRKTWQDMKAAAKKKRLARRALAEPPAREPAGDMATDNTLDCVEFEETEQDTERMLINLVGQHKCLWHPADPDYCNKRLRDALWGDIARQLPALSGSPASPELARRKWQELRTGRAALRGGQDSHQAHKHAGLMDFLDEADEFSEQYVDASEPIQDPLENICDQYSSPEPEDRKTPTEKPQKKKHFNTQRISHQRTLRRFQRLDPSNPQSEDDSESAAGDVLRAEDGHTHFCLSLAPLMRALPPRRLLQLRIQMLQLLRDVMEAE